jgi:hypothetical protein
LEQEKGKMIVETKSGLRRVESDPRPRCKGCGPTESVVKPGRGLHAARLEYAKCGRFLKCPVKTVPVRRTLPGGDNGVRYRTR